MQRLLSAGVTRRSFLAWTTALLPAALLVRCKGAGTARIEEDETLRALASTVLPHSSLGSRGTARVAADFRRWLDGYRPGAELLHGYGTSDLSYSGPSPAARWSAQLQEFESNSLAQYGHVFSDLTADQRRALVQAQLAGEELESWPSPGAARHVATGLLAYFYNTSEATDLCYGAAIGRNTCRPLASSAERPVPLQRRV